MLNAVADTETDLYLKENDDKYTVIFFTQSSSVRIQQSDCRELNSEIRDRITWCRFPTAI